MKRINYLLSAIVLFSLILMSCEKEPIANFTASETEAEAGDVITFTNLSEHASSYLWDFGDGDTSTIESPSHVYENGGSYTVSLTASGKKGDIISTQQITILAPVMGVTDYTIRGVSSVGSITGFDINGTVENTGDATANNVVVSCTTSEGDSGNGTTTPVNVSPGTTATFSVYIGVSSLPRNIVFDVSWD